MNKDISALMDGELEESLAPTVFNQLQRADAEAAWRTYHLIGDVLKGYPPIFSDIGTKVAERLADEPTILAPKTRRIKNMPIAAIGAAASLAAVAFVGWVALQTNVGNVNDALIASNYKFLRSVATQHKPDAISADVNPYLLAHQEFSPSTNMHGVGPYLRTVSEVEQGVAR